MHNREYRFSVTLHTNDLAVVYCMRALADYCQKTENTRKAWGGTGNKHWQERKRVTFRFTTESYRAEFLREVRRLLCGKLWKIIELQPRPERY